MKKSPSTKTRKPKGASAQSAFPGADWSPYRSSVYFMPQEGAKEVDIWARVELTRRARALRNGLAEMRLILEMVKRWAVGIGVFPIAMTRDELWNEKVEQKWDDHAMSDWLSDDRGDQNFYEIQQTIPGNLLVDGGCYFALVKGQDGYRRVRSIDTMRIGNAGGVDEDGERVRDGIIRNGSGRRLGYRVPTDGGGYRDVSTRDMVFLANLERVGQGRELTWFYSGLNSGQDLIELMASEKAGAKLQNLLALAIKRQNAKGETGRMYAPGKAKVGSADSLKVENEEEERRIRRDLERFTGAGTIAYLAPGDEIQLLKTERTDEKTVTLINLLISDLCWSCGFSPDAAFFLSKLGGATTRGSIADFAAFVVYVQDIVNKLNNRVWRWKVAGWMKDGEIPQCRDPRWWEVLWQGPPSLNVDLGKTGELSIKLHDHGFLTEADYWSGLGKDWRKQQDQHIREIRRAKIKCMEASGIAPEEAERRAAVDYYLDFRRSQSGAAQILGPNGQPVSSEENE